ncbi:MAG: VirD4-like conjugal transfer protein, CD1115 family [Bacilli bacterium]
MKFRISSKDLIIFIVFSVFLLYLCAIGVMNFTTFGAEGKLWGLNPFPAFGPKFIGITLMLFVIAMIMIFSSVSSYIFEKEKGRPGLDVRDKEEKGYARWAKDKEIKTDRDVEVVTTTDEKTNAAGVPLAIDMKKNQIWVDNGEYHTLVIGSSGSGKSRCIVKPLVNLLAKKGESMIITDPKGELYTSAANRLKELGYNVIVLNFRDPSHGNAWNPLTLPYQYQKMGNKDKSTELLDDVALNILYDPNNKGEPFWEKSAADFFSGLALGLFQDAKEDEININSINVMSTVGEERLGASNYTKEYFTMKGEASSPYIFASNTINAPSDTKGGIMSTFRQKIRLFASRENLSEMLSHSDFSLLDIGKQKTAVFIVIHDEKTTYHALATIFIKQCYETLIDVAQENGGRLPIRTNFILDEFANMPPLKDVDSMVTAARSRGMRFTFIIQNFAQLNDVYGKEVAEVIRGNCGNTIYLISTELAALEEISKMCGEVKSKEKDKTASTPLVTVTDLQKLKFGEAILMRLRKSPFKTKLPMNDQVNWGYTIQEASFPIRPTKPVEIFDIKTFVKEKKKEKMMAEGNNNPMGGGFNPMNPFGGGMSPFGDMASPFGGSMPNPFDAAPKSSSPFSTNLDLDAMMRDIDRKIAELDAEEARAKEEEKKKQEASNTLVSTPTLEPKSETDTANKNIPTPDIDTVLKEIEKPLANNVVEPEPQIKPIIEPVAPTPIKEPTIIQPEPVVQVQPKTVEVEPKPRINQSSFNFDLPSIDNYQLPKTEVKEPTKIEIPTPKVEEKHEEVKNNVLNSQDKPKINVDVDSVVFNNNVISDDEFFDDFFGDDDE